MFCNKNTIPKKGFTIALRFSFYNNNHLISACNFGTGTALSALPIFNGK